MARKPRARLSALAVVGFTLLALPQGASAGRLVATGHDADLHCSGGQQCHYFSTALGFVRAGAPDPAKPVLILDRLDLDAERALDNAFPPAGSVPRVVIEPRSPTFASQPIDVSRFSAIIVASDTTCGGCDLNEFGSTPDSDAINARKSDIAKFFNDGGGLFVLAGANHGGGNEEKTDDTYYSFVPLPLGGVAVTNPFTLTDLGKSMGFHDRPNGIGTEDDINCCATHNSFTMPAAGSPLQVAELDSKGFAETLVVSGGRIGSGGFEPGTGTTTPPKPADVIKFPPTRKCLSKRNFRIHLVQPKNGETLEVASVKVNGKPVSVIVKKKTYRTLKGRVLDVKRLSAQVDLRGLPKGTYNVVIRAVTNTTRVLKGTRQYKTCAQRRPGGRPPV